jgi:hypothetical protein
MPSHELRQFYNPLEEQWAFKVHFDDLRRPMSWKDAQVAWLLFQRHVRDLIGLCNFFDAQFLEQYEYGPTRLPWTFNLVGVLHESVPEGEIRQTLLQHGVPILEHFRSPTGRPADRCHTCEWVKAQRQELKQQHPKIVKFNPQQSLHPEARNDSKAAAAARPNKRSRAHAVSQSQWEPPENAEAGSSTLPKDNNRVVRQAVAKKAAITEISPYGGATSKKKILEMRAFDNPAQWRRDRGRILLPTQGGVTSTAYAPSLHPLYPKKWVAVRGHPISTSFRFNFDPIGSLEPLKAACIRRTWRSLPGMPDYPITLAEQSRTSIPYEGAIGTVQFPSHILCFHFASTP